MTTYIDDLRRNLETLAQCGISAETCSILKDMLDHDELAYWVDAGTPRWFSKGSNRLLDQIIGLEDETESLLVELLVDGKVEFTVNDCGQGLNIRWAPGWWLTSSIRAASRLGGGRDGKQLSGALNCSQGRRGLLIFGWRLPST